MSLQESSYAKSVENPGFFSRFRSEWLIIGAAVIIVGWLALVPLVFLLWQSCWFPRRTEPVRRIISIEN